MSVVLKKKFCSQYLQYRLCFFLFGEELHSALMKEGVRTVEKMVLYIQKRPIRARDYVLKGFERNTFRVIGNFPRSLMILSRNL